MHEKEAFAEKILPVADKAIQALKPVFWGNWTPKWLWPAFGSAVAAPFIGHHLREKREEKEALIKRLHMQQRLRTMQAMFPFDEPPRMREAENAVGEALGKKAQMDPAAGGMPGGTPGAGGPPMPPSMLAGYKPPGSYPPAPEPMPSPPARVEKGLDIIRKSLRDAKMRAGKKRARSLGLDNPADRDESSLGDIVQRRRERMGH